MSILKNTYEISVWQEGFDSNGSIVERKLGIIGTSNMIAQCRALEPNFTRNVNGSKKLSFKMYRYYTDELTGERVENPYIANGWMVSERKVKLKYKNKWYDFAIKDIAENSSNYLYTYSLEEIYVQELSKNGFNITFDTQLMNNTGSAKFLAEQALVDTDWTVESEKFVQTVEESLVYLNASRINSKLLKDSNIESNGVEDGGSHVINGVVLAFYSCCTDRPNRFQFIYTDNLQNLERDEHRNITQKMCQYYIDIDQDEYVKDSFSGFYLPKGFSLYSVDEFPNDGISRTAYISEKYRGKRYGFSQQSKFIPSLDKYVKLYNKYSSGNIVKDENGEPVTYYGYEQIKYISPALTTNLISNSTFESASGWTGTGTFGSNNSTNKLDSDEKAVVESVYGYFNNGVFISAIDELNSGNLNFTDSSGNSRYKAYLKLVFPSSKSLVVNSGPYDNRSLIENMVSGTDKYAFYCKVLTENGTPVQCIGDELDFYLDECKYHSSSLSYENYSGGKLQFDHFTAIGSNNGGFSADGEKKHSVKDVQYKGASSGYSNAEFKKNSNVRLCIKRATSSSQRTYYIEEIELFKATYNAGGILIPLDEQGNSLSNRVLDKTFYFFSEKAIDNILNIDDLVGYDTLKELDYSIYKPMYNNGAEKIRSINIKESNYFNILQTIAETFGAWVELDVEHDETGKSGKKIVRLKNYIGNNNYSGFKYGVNLKDIQRTYASKNIVTKLMVKQNSNEYAEDGFCTIARAGANPTGDTSIYDFQYYHNTGLLSARQYLEDAYSVDGYFPKITNFNKQLREKNKLALSLSQDLVQYNAQKEVAEAGIGAAESGMEDAASEYEQLTGFGIESSPEILSVTIDNTNVRQDASLELKSGHISYNYDSISVIVIRSFKELDGWKISVECTLSSAASVDSKFWIEAYPKITTNGGTVTQKITIDCTVQKGFLRGVNTKNIFAIDSERTDIKKIQTEYLQNKKKYDDFTLQLERVNNNLAGIKVDYTQLEQEIDNIKQSKNEENIAFYKKYSRFIQEGTWISEEYVDDNKYYADALSVIYNSCYPQVAYQINVIALDSLGEQNGTDYSCFSMDIGDKTFVEDSEFFGQNNKEPVTIVQLSENLDDPNKNVIQVQNFKTQFQDLFQKITATVQQTQYSTGAYEKAVALAEANQEKKNQFMAEALNAADARLTAAGQQSVEWGDDGITVKSLNSPSDMIRMVGGAILLSKQDENGQQKWVTGVTADGISASLITAGMLNAGEICIMNANEPVFRWDAFGITAYDYFSYTGDYGSSISGINTKKFVRFDKNGLYGINSNIIDGSTWHPQNSSEILSNATFGLTWEGLKVSNSKGITLHIGDGAKTDSGDASLLRVSNNYDKTLVRITENGDLLWGDSENSGIPFKKLWCKSETLPSLPTGDISEYPESASDVQDITNNPYKWHTKLSSEDNYSCESDDYGVANSWKGPYQMAGRDGESSYSIQFSDGFVPVSASPTGAIEEGWNKYINVSVKKGLEECYIVWEQQSNGYNFNGPFYIVDAKNSANRDLLLSVTCSNISTYMHSYTTEDNIRFISNFRFRNLASDVASAKFEVQKKEGATIEETYASNSISFAKQKQGVQGIQGIQGISGETYRISLDEDFVTIPATNLGDISEGSVTITPTVYFGNNEVEWTDNNNNLSIEVVPSYLSRSGPSNGKYTIGWSSTVTTVDRAIATFILKHNGSEVDRTTFEAVKQKGSMGAIQCYVHSSKGTIFDEADEGEVTTLTAKIFEGTTPIDPNGKLTYAWYKNGQHQTGWGNKNEARVALRLLKDSEIYFTAK